MRRALLVVLLAGSAAPAQPHAWQLPAATAAGGGLVAGVHEESEDALWAAREERYRRRELERTASAPRLAVTTGFVGGAGAVLLGAWLVRRRRVRAVMAGAVLLGAAGPARADMVMPVYIEAPTAAIHNPRYTLGGFAAGAAVAGAGLWLVGRLRRGRAGANRGAK